MLGELSTWNRAPSLRHVEAGIFLLAAFLVCLAVRVSTLHANFWEAELIAAAAIELGWLDLLRDRFAAGDLPLYYALLKLLGLAGASEFMLRLPSAVLDSIACVLFAATARIAAGRIGGAFTALCYAFMPVLIRFGQEARPYPLLAFFFGLAFLSAATLWRTATPMPGSEAAPGGRATARLASVLFVAGSVGAGWTMIPGWLAVLALHVSVVASPSPVGTPAFRRRWLRLCAIAWLGILPAIALAFPHLGRFAETFWTPDPFRPGMSSLAADVVRIYGWPAEGDLDRFFPAGWHPYLAVALAGLAAFSLFRPRTPIRQAGFVALAVPLGLFAAHLLRSGVVLRYVHPSLWCLCVLYGAGAARLARSWAGAIVVAGLACAIVLQGLDGAVAPRKADWQPFLRFFAGNHLGAAPGIVTEPGLTLLLARNLSEPERPATVSLAVGGDDLDVAIAGALASERLFWILSGQPLKRLTGGLPATAAICAGGIGYHSFVVVARAPADMPASIRACGTVGR